MYLKYYRLRKEPFHITPDPEFLYLSSGHEKALSSIIHGVEQKKGFIAITGEVGVGKTTILHTYLQIAKQRGVKTILILNPQLTFRSLLRIICHELDYPGETGQEAEMLSGLQHLLIKHFRRKHDIVLLIDEAHNLPVQILQNLRLLSDLETSKDKLMEIVLIGQPELVRLLQLRELQQLKQRVAIHTNIPPLSPRESLEYMKHRLKRAGGDIDRIFTKQAISRIIEESNGIPRLMNIICDNALITGFGYGQELVGRKIVKEVVADLKVQQKPSFFLRWDVALSLVVLVIAFYFSIPYVKILVGKDRVEVARQIATSSVLNGTTVNETLPRDNPGNETRSSQVTSVAKSGDYSPNREDPVGMSNQGRREERVSRETSDAPKTLTAADVNGGSSPVVAPPESAPPPTLNAHSHSTSESPVLVAEPIKSTPDPRKKSVRKTVKKGDTLHRLATEVYGYSRPEIIAILQQHNPHIRNPDRIMVGDEVFFPVVDGTKYGR